MKALRVVVVLLIAVAFILPAASAQAAYITCWVNLTGQTAAGKLAKFTNADGTGTTAPQGVLFKINTGSASNDTALFSVCLTAMASGMKVYVNLPNPSTPGSDCTGGYLQDQ
jgi:hypothetical protein